MSPGSRFGRSSRATARGAGAMNRATSALTTPARTAASTAMPSPARAPPRRGTRTKIPGGPRSTEPVQPAFPANGRSGTRTAADPRPEAVLSRRRHRHRVDKSLPGSTFASRRCRAGMSTSADSTRRSTLPSANADRARAAPGSRHTPIRGSAYRSYARRRWTAASVTMAVACMVVSSTWAGARPAAFLPFFRHARTCSIAVRFNFGTGSVATGETVSAPPLSPRT